MPQTSYFFSTTCIRIYSLSVLSVCPGVSSTMLSTMTTAFAGQASEHVNTDYARRGRCCYCRRPAASERPLHRTTTHYTTATINMCRLVLGDLGVFQRFNIYGNKLESNEKLKKRISQHFRETGGEHSTRAPRLTTFRSSRIGARARKQ